jgi:hypothetical protein
MPWNYRIIRRIDDTGTYYGIHEVYYHEDGRPRRCSTFPSQVCSLDVSGTLLKMQQALSRPVLVEVNGDSNKLSELLDIERTDMYDINESAITAQ